MAFNRHGLAASNNSTLRGELKRATSESSGPPRIHNYRTADPLTGSGGMFATAPTKELAQTTAYFNKVSPTISGTGDVVVEDFLGLFEIVQQGDILEVVHTIGTTDALLAPAVGAVAGHRVSFSRLLCQGYAEASTTDKTIQPIFTLIN